MVRKLKGGDYLFGFKKKETRSTKQLSYVSTQSWRNLVYDDGYTSLSKNTDVISAVNVIAELVSNMSIHLLENTDTGDKRVKNGLSRLIDIEPAIGMTRKAWVSKIVRDLYLYGDGNSICHIIVKSGDDYLSELKPLNMSKVAYKYDDQKNDLKVVYDNKELDSSQLVHFLINPDAQYPLIGTGFQSILSTVLNNLTQADKTKSQFMKGRYMPNIIIKVDSDSEELGTTKGKKKIKEKYLKNENSMEPWVIPADLLEVQQVKPLTLKDIALNESVELDKKTVAAMFGIPPFLLGVGEFNKSEFNNFVNTRIAGIGQMIGQTLTKDVLLNPNWYFKFNPRSLYQYNLTELVNSGGAMVDRTAMTRNEWRDWVGLAPREDMEELITLENYVPTEKLGDQNKLKGGDDDVEEENIDDSNGELSD